jgi:hypothetical protein
MEPSAFAQAAISMAGIGALCLTVAVLNIVALRAVRVDEVPGCMRRRILWWGAHNSAFLVASAALTAIGLAALAGTSI